MHAGRKELLGTEHPDTLEAEYKLVLCLHHQDKHREAEKMVHKLLVLFGRMYGMEHLMTLKTRDVLAKCLIDKGEYEEAAATLNEVLAVRKRVQGEVHPHTQGTTCNLARSFSGQGKHSEAQVLHCDMRRACTLAWGPDDPKTLNVSQNSFQHIQARRRGAAGMHKRPPEDPPASHKKAKT